MKYLEKNFYVCGVAASGGDGSIANPFISLEEAKEAVKNYREQVGEYTCVHITVYLRGGTYYMNQTFVLEEANGGSETHQVTYRAYPGEEVIFDAGEKIDTSLFRPMTAEETTLVKAGMESHIVVADLDKTIMNPYFPIPGNDALDHNKTTDFGAIAWNEVLLQVAQWPNHGYVHIKEIFDQGPITRFLLKGETVPAYSWEKPSGARFDLHEQTDFGKANEELQRTKEVFCCGYPDNDWFYQREQVQSMEEGVIRFLKETRYGVRDLVPLPRRVKFVNLLCELDEPGEWYYERSTGKLFMYPLVEMNENVKLAAVGKVSPVISLQNTTNVEICDITIQNGGDVGVMIEGGKDNLLGGCTIRNARGMGFKVVGGVHNGITGCNLYGLERAFFLKGGDQKMFIPSNHYVTNCDIYEIRNKGYELGVFSGFGMLLAHNIIHDTNGGVNYCNCGEMIAEYNEFYRSGLEMGDWNPIYSGANCVSVGCILRYNFVHHLMELPEAYPLGGMRGDDNDVGNTFYGNVFYKSGRCALETSGPANRMLNNVILECPQGIYAWVEPEEKRKKSNDEYFADCFNDNYVEQERKGDFWRQMLHATGDRFYYNSPDWSFRYPLLRMSMNRAPIWESYVEVTKNYHNSSCEEFFHIYGGTEEDYPETAYLEQGVELSLDAFEDVETLNFKFKDDFKLMDGFYPIPFDKIGLQIDEYRKTAPDKETYRREVYQQFKEVPSCFGTYNRETENDHYPLAPYKKYAMQYGE